MKRTSENEGTWNGGVRLSRSISGAGKRVSLFHDGADEVSTTMNNGNTLKRQCSEKLMFCPAMSLLEALPLDLLIRVLCFVDHDDLKQLILVSKPVGEASLVAKKCHFEYSTPKKIAAFRNSKDLDCYDDDDDDGDDSGSAPNAPKQDRRRRLRSGQSGGGKKKFGDISVALFASSEKDSPRWPRKQQM